LRLEGREGPLTAARAHYAELCRLTDRYVELDTWKVVWRDREFRELLAVEFDLMRAHQERAARELARLL
jgi:hypothetical protein